MIGDRLAEKTILVTGAGGFLGQGLVERLLRDVPRTRILLVLRPTRTASVGARARRLLAKQVFDGLREALGKDGLERRFGERVEVLEGDLTRPLDLPGGIDIVFHCAATVSFDPPVDQAFKTNVLGTLHLYDALRATGGRAHVVHVSTAYVAGMRKGIITESSLEHDVAWRTELDAALAARPEVERASRDPDRLREFIKRSSRSHRRAGPVTVASHSEQRRAEWVDERLVDHGRLRARSLGWPDVYTLSKALGERVAEESRGDLPVSIVRPSIIESALQHPYPGWIDGFKMADPLILAYGRGEMPEFPGIPEGIVDVIPIDMVVNALLAAAASPPDDGVNYFHVSSGWRNPLTYRGLYELVRDYFEAHPLSDRVTGEIAVPEWRFPGKSRIDLMLKGGGRLLDLAERASSFLPRSKSVRGAVERLDDSRRRFDFLRRHSDLYGDYTEAEVVYTDDRTYELFSSLDYGDRSRFPFDPTAIDWRHYLQDVHCPSVTSSIRVRRPRARGRRAATGVRPGDGVAVFDLEGTVSASNVVESYLWLRLAGNPRARWAREAAAVARALPSLIASDRRDRGEFLRRFYRRYEGMSEDDLRRLIEESVGQLLFRRTSPDAIRRVREHRAAGHKTILITGALDVFAAPLAPLFDEIVSTRIARDARGRLSGFLEHPPIVGEARAAWLQRCAADHGFDLEESYAYADSHSDLPLLQTVGHPVAVNPDIGLMRAARRRHWRIEEWTASEGTPRILLPESVP